MENIRGIGASDGIAIGKLVLFNSKSKEVTKKCVENSASELARVEAAKNKALKDLNQIYLNSLKLVGQKDSMIFQIHIMMIQDEDFFGAIQSKIKDEKVNAEYAVWTVGQEFAERFAQMDNDYMRNRKTDVIDIAQRLIQCLSGQGNDAPKKDSGQSIMGAVDLTPSETVEINKHNTLAIVTRNGSRNSHSAILSRTMGIPSVVGLSDDFDKLTDGMTVIVDGSTGEIFTEPTGEIMKEYQKKQREFTEYHNSLKKLIGSKAVTKDGVEIEVNANIAHPADADDALKNGADGIGLFRSEFLYMEHDSLPTEDEQFNAYRKVLEKMDGKRVIIRTFDIGADKQVPYLNLPKEANPALGYRAIRICLDRKDLFYTQLRALLRASVFGKLSIMFPMIISVGEIKEAKKMVEQVKKDLAEEKIAFAQDVKIGIMIETPASVMLSGELAKEADFFSIGTNDLTQYTLAVDRMNGKISKMYDQRHPAVLKMIEMTAKSAKKAGIPVGICGESAADTSLMKFYLKAGINELSVGASAVLGLKKAVIETSLS